MPFHLATPEQIKSGEVVDIYFRRTAEILEAKGVEARVRAEFVAKSLPDDWPWAVLAGVEELANLLEGVDVNVRALPEGQVFRAMQPVVEIEGDYRAFAVFETAALGLLCQATGIATRAARCRKAAGPTRKLISFGARRMHPAIAPMIERAAYIGGCDGVAVVASADLIGSDAVGTIPHALVLVMRDTLEAARAFDEVIDPAVPRIVLIDTFMDEKFETLRIADAMKGRLAAVRLDTPGTRRGDFAGICREVRWELDLRGHTDVQLFASGGIDERAILRLNEWVDGYGVGSAIAAAPVVDFAMDIVEIDGEPFAKRGKWSGAKEVLRCADCARDAIVPLHDRSRWPERCPACGGGDLAALLRPLVEAGRVVEPPAAPAELRERVLARLHHYDIDWKREAT